MDKSMEGGVKNKLEKSNQGVGQVGGISGFNLFISV